MAPPNSTPPSIASDMTTVEPAPPAISKEKEVDAKTPVIVAFAEHDPGDPRAFSPARKWLCVQCFTPRL